MTLTAVSLFAGIEGIGLALHRAGIRVTAAVEIDDAARGVIADRMPDTALLTDVTKVTADDLRATGFDPDRGLVAAGWPCQGNSVAGRRGGMADPRSGLWVHVARLLAELRPRWFLGENVPGLLSVNGGRDFAAVIGDLAGLGYGYAWRVLDAQHFGVPQRRRRVFIVGRVGDRSAPVQVLLEPEGRGGDSAAGREAGQVVTALTANGIGGGGADDNNAQGGQLISFAWQAGGKNDASGAFKDDGTTPTLPRSQTLAIAHSLTAEGADASEDGTGRGTPLVTVSNDSSPVVGHDSIGALKVGTGLDLPSVPAVHAGTAVRRLTPLECERLQGFPDGWTATSNGKPQSDSARYRQLGNAVAVPCVEWIARRIADTETARAGP